MLTLSLQMQIHLTHDKENWPHKCITISYHKSNGDHLNKRHIDNKSTNTILSCHYLKSKNPEDQDLSQQQRKGKITYK